MNGIYLYFVNKHVSSWPLLGLKTSSKHIIWYLNKPSPADKKIRLADKKKTCLKWNILQMKCIVAQMILTYSQRSPGFYLSAVQVF